MTKTARPTNQDLLRRIRELEAQLASTLASADADLRKLDSEFVGSAVLVSLHLLGGRALTPTFAIRDGLSIETVAALRADIRRSYRLATMHGPQNVGGEA